MSPGEKARRHRKHEREALSYAAALAIVTAKGGRCGNCNHVLRNPGTLRGIYCGLESDFHGYAVTRTHSVCAQWAPATLK